MLSTSGRATQPGHPEASTGATSTAMPHLPGLDGLRAVAVIAVVLYHLGVSWMPGGFLGVDVFFVLSGFLITSLLLDEVEVSGRLRLGSFYLRRARRLLPALGLLLLTVSTGSVLFWHSSVGELRGDVAAAALYVSNWWQVVADRSYFEFVSRPPLLQHLWSLAVEEQFYLVWPLAVLVLVKWGRRLVGWVALGLAAASTVVMTVVSVTGRMPVPNDPSRAYYGTDTHAMGLLLGAALAAAWTPWRTWHSQGSWRDTSTVTVRRFEAKVADGVGLVAIAGLVWAFVAVGEFSIPLYRGGFGLVALVATAAVAALADPAGLLGRAMGTQPLRYLGQRSYGIYLWHWPVFMVTRPGFEISHDDWRVTALRIGITMLAAELSYRYVETPIRHGVVGVMWRRVAAQRTWPLARRGTTIVGIVTAMAVTSAIGFAAIDGNPPASPQPPASVATHAPTHAPLPTPPHPSTAPTPTPAATPVDEVGTVSAFGDSVMLGAATELTNAGFAVDAVESRQFSVMLEDVKAAKDAGTLGHTVIVHGGTNGPIDEGELRALCDLLPDHRLYLVNLYVPRNWEGFNNDLLARVVPEYPQARLLDWHSEAAANLPWLYNDNIHLRPGGGREGYAAWLVASIQPAPAPAPASGG